MPPNIDYLPPAVQQSTAPFPIATTCECSENYLSSYCQIQPEGHIVYQLPGSPKQSLIDQEHWPPVFKPQNVRSVKNMQPRDDDVFVCTYPKCGTTWIQHICAQLMNENYGPTAGHELSMTSPMIDRMGADYADKISSPRLLKTHFTWKNLPKSSKAKYIFCVRNPKDCLTSYFFHNQNFKIYNYECGEFDDFFEWFMSDKIAFGNYYWHLLSWLPHVNDENVLFLKYEDMYADLRSAVIKIGHFLGGSCARKVENEELLEQIVAESKFDSMKKNQSRWFPAENLRGKPFIRKGGSRDWKNYFTREQSDRMDAQWRKEVAGTIAENWWKSEMAWEEDDNDDEGILDDFCPVGRLSLPDNNDFMPELNRKTSSAIAIVSSRQHLPSISTESAYGSFDDSFIGSWH